MMCCAGEQKVLGKKLKTRTENFAAIRLGLGVHGGGEEGVFYGMSPEVRYTMLS